ncbi:MAG: hypothetical protein ABIC91_04875 [Nanoarchaeota archaeon]|nr:hypothetical protein [Nanoarchaeota archaeon]MBU1031138.1 hypothetical protein [Nanoarchaeota archaeon]MBU1850141.1 hypothetical protein [Nanoarchaeota archaeon]
MKKTAIFGMLAILLVGLLTTGLVSAYRGDSNVQGPDYSEDRHEAMEDAFESQDYNAWYNLMAENGRNTRVMNVVTEGNFAIFAQAHEAAENGDFETAAELRAELGLNNGNGLKDGTGYSKEMGQGMNQGLKSGMEQGMKQGNMQELRNGMSNKNHDDSCNNLGSRIERGLKGRKI